MAKPLQTILTRSFGFDPRAGTHHFVVNVSASADVQVSEHLTWDAEYGSSQATSGVGRDGQVRVLLARPKWDAIADMLRVEFNLRLRQDGLSSGSWGSGANCVRRELGKELTLLCWAIEEADPGLIPVAIANWRGLVPEERWWLYTQTAAATGHAIEGRGRGWRRAVRYALTENPLSSSVADVHAPTPDFFRRAEEHAAHSNRQMTLLDKNVQYEIPAE